MKIIFMGSPDFAVPTLSALIKSKHEVEAIFTSPPRPKNRGMKLGKSPIHMLGDEYNIKVYNPTSLKTEDTTKILENIEVDIIIVVAYGFIVPKNIIEMKQYGCLNLHPSSLPRFRGAAPLQRTIIAGDTSTEICIMQMDEGLDTGDILLKEKLELDERITLPKLHDKCAEIGANLMLEALDNIDNIHPQKQSETGLVYADKLQREESKIDWSLDAVKIDCKIRGMNPWPGTYFQHEGQDIKILEAKYEDIAHDALPGTILDNDLSIACGKGILKIEKLQSPGKKPLPTKDFLKGYRINKGDVL